ncbi:hypothetical protein S245_070904, partial [Arachis hypogaea]
STFERQECRRREWNLHEMWMLQLVSSGEIDHSILLWWLSSLLRLQPPFPFFLASKSKHR